MHTRNITHSQIHQSTVEWGPQHEKARERKSEFLLTSEIWVIAVWFRGNNNSRGFCFSYFSSVLNLTLITVTDSCHHGNFLFLFVAPSQKSAGGEPAVSLFPVKSRWRIQTASLKSLISSRKTRGRMNVRRRIGEAKMLHGVVFHSMVSELFQIEWQWMHEDAEMNVRLLQIDTLERGTCTGTTLWISFVRQESNLSIAYNVTMKLHDRIWNLAVKVNSF